MMLLKDFVPVDWSRIKGVVSQNKDDCIKWIKKYIDLGIKFRCFGVEAFEKECSISKNQFEKIALEMSINGDCPEYAFTVMGNFIQTSQMDSMEYFQDIVTFQFVILEYAESVSIAILIKVLGSLLGLQAFNELKAEYMQYFHQDF